jgi:hypothetical protein
MLQFTYNSTVQACIYIFLQIYNVQASLNHRSNAPCSCFNTFSTIKFKLLEWTLFSKNGGVFFVVNLSLTIIFSEFCSYGFLCLATHPLILYNYKNIIFFLKTWPTCFQLAASLTQFLFLWILYYISLSLFCLSLFSLGTYASLSSFYFSLFLTLFFLSLPVFLLCAYVFSLNM